jgi:hypothetical protein
MVEPPLVVVNPLILAGILTTFHEIKAPAVGELILMEALLFCEQMV